MVGNQPELPVSEIPLKFLTRPLSPVTIVESGKWGARQVTGRNALTAQMNSLKDSKYSTRSEMDSLEPENLDTSSLNWVRK